MSDFNELARVTLGELQGFITTELKKQSQEAVADAKAFLESAREDLQRWVGLLGSGQLTPEDFAWLVKGRKDLVVMEALKRKGVALVKLEQFQNQLLSAAANAALNLAGAGLNQVLGGPPPATRGAGVRAAKSKAASRPARAAGGKPTPKAGGKPKRRSA